MGSGTMAVMVCILISIICCFFRASCKYPNGCLVLLILFPIIVFAIIYWLPKEGAKRTDQAPLPTSSYFMKCIIFTILIFSVCCVSLGFLFSIKLTETKVTRKDSEAVKDKEPEEKIVEQPKRRSMDEEDPVENLNRSNNKSDDYNEGGSRYY